MNELISNCDSCLELTSVSYYATTDNYHCKNCITEFRKRATQ
jgi:hypothetical protein